MPTTELSKRISQRKADMGRLYPGAKIGKATVHWGAWRGDGDEREVRVVFSNGEAVASFEAIADFITEDVRESTGNTYIRL